MMFNVSCLKCIYIYTHIYILVSVSGFLLMFGFISYIVLHTYGQFTICCPTHKAVIY